METTEIGPARSRRLLESREWRDDGWGDRGGADDSPLLTQREVAWTPPPRRFSTTARGEIGADEEKVPLLAREADRARRIKGGVDHENEDESGRLRGRGLCALVTWRSPRAGVARWKAAPSETSMQVRCVHGVTRATKGCDRELDGCLTTLWVKDRTLLRQSEIVAALVNAKEKRRLIVRWRADFVKHRWRRGLDSPPRVQVDVAQSGAECSAKSMEKEFLSNEPTGALCRISEKLVRTREPMQILGEEDEGREQMGGQQRKFSAKSRGKEFHVDGFRFDLSKGFTQTYSGNDATKMAQYDQSRVDILTDYYNWVQAKSPGAYCIMEHFADNNEEQTLSSKGMMLWGNGNFNANEAGMGFSNSDFGYGIDAQKRSFGQRNLVGYIISHDEERMGYKCKNFGNSTTGYSVKDPNVYVPRVGLAYAFVIATPGPKMIWQFDELAYDYSINTCEDGVTDRKSVV